MKIVFLGATKFSFQILECLYKNGFETSAIFTIPQEFKISYSDKKVKNYNFFDLKAFAEKKGIKTYEVDSKNGQKLINYKSVIEEIQPDLILVMGWYYMVPKQIRNIAKHGAWGIHASMLPDYAGGAPLVWAIIEGQTETGVTLFKIDSGVDDGDIIMQESFSIDQEDSIKEVYEKATEISKQILISALKNIDSLTPLPQDKSKIKIYPQRNPGDGELDLNKTAIELYNFIRAQSSPYPGAFIKTVDNKKLIIEKARVENF